MNAVTSVVTFALLALGHVKHNVCTVFVQLPRLNLDMEKKVLGEVVCVEIYVPYAMKIVVGFVLITNVRNVVGSHVREIHALNHV